MDEVHSLQTRLTLNENLSIDTRYADDTTLIAAIFNKVSLSTEELESSCRKWGIKVNSLKCKIISPELNDIQIDRRNVEKVQEFTFLGSVVPGTSSDVSRRIGLVLSAFGRLKPKLWSNRIITLSLKVRISFLNNFHYCHLRQ